MQSFGDLPFLHGHLFPVSMVMLASSCCPLLLPWTFLVPGPLSFLMLSSHESLHEMVSGDIAPTLFSLICEHPLYVICTLFYLMLYSTGYETHSL